MRSTWDGDSEIRFQAPRGHFQFVFGQQIVKGAVTVKGPNVLKPEFLIDHLFKVRDSYGLLEYFTSFLPASPAIVANFHSANGQDDGDDEEEEAADNAPGQ